MPGRFPSRLTCALAALLAIPSSHSQSKPAITEWAAFPAREALFYTVEWRLIYAGGAHLSLEPKRRVDKTGWEAKLDVESGGLVSKLYKIEDKYQVETDNQFCTTVTDLEAIESKRHRVVTVTYDYTRGKALHVERDLIKNTTVRSPEADIPACVSDIVGALLKLRALHLEPGQSAQLPVSDGKKAVSARVEAQEREQIKTNVGTFNTVRYEAFVFNGVLFARKAQLQIWLTDDARSLPVQIRARMGFPVGSITFTLDKSEMPEHP